MNLQLNTESWKGLPRGRSRELGPEKQGKAIRLMAVQGRKPLYPEAVCAFLHPATTAVASGFNHQLAESGITWKQRLSKGVSTAGWPLEMPVRNFLIGLIEL